MNKYRLQYLIFITLADLKLIKRCQFFYFFTKIMDPTTNIEIVAQPLDLTPSQQAAQLARDEMLSCRFYEELLPEQDTCVMVNIKQITDVGTYVSLLEYGGIEGMILLSELTRRRIRSINKLVSLYESFDAKANMICLTTSPNSLYRFELERMRLPWFLE